jgi:RNA polymerase sigma-70 factor (ECF subfamily)
LTERKLAVDDVRQLYEQHGGVLLAYARSLVSNRSSAEDAVQQVFLKLLHGETVVPDVPLAYLYHAVRNAALNGRRSGAREVGMDGHERWFSHRGGNREAEFALQETLAELPEEQRTAVVMRIWSGMTLEEVAAATGVPLYTAASRYRYALEHLRERMKPYQKAQVKDHDG